jgi:hypothetical protein
MKRILITILLLSYPKIISAQIIKGKLVDQSGAGLPNLQATLYITPNAYKTTSASDGSFAFANISSVEKEALPEGYVISNNYPNPFNPSTRINITVPVPSIIKIELVNMLGQSAADVIERHSKSGDNYFDLELDGLPNGTYFARISIDNKYSVVKKLMLLYGTNHLIASTPDLKTNYPFKKVTGSIRIDSLVVTGSYVEKKVITDLPLLIGTSLDLGNIVIDVNPPSEVTNL